jgi:hypothetical protein
MSNQLIQSGTVVQSTSLASIWGNQLVTGGVKQESSQACIVDLIPPVFGGISFLGLGVLGQFQIQYSAGLDPSTPVRYEIYIQAGTATGLFNLINVALVTQSLTTDLFALADGSLLVPATTYFVGVRAVDAVGNRDSNLVSLSLVSPGITGANIATISGMFAVDDTNDFIGSFWVADSLGTITNPLRLGTASFIVYDNNGNAVPGFTQSGIIPDINGFFEITPIPSILDFEHNFYAAKVTIAVDGVPITYTLPVTQQPVLPQYETRAVFSISPINQLQGTFWVINNTGQVTDDLGTASFSIRDVNGALIGIAQSGLVADVNGFYKMAPVSASVLTSLTHYTVQIEINAHGGPRTGCVGLSIAE